MRVIECDVCGAPLTADSDDELAGRLSAHLAETHEMTPSPEDVAETVSAEVYEATDS
jgi:predicted small metal-binding protein